MDCCISSAANSKSNLEHMFFEMPPMRAERSCLYPGQSVSLGSCNSQSQINVIQFSDMYLWSERDSSLDTYQSDTRFPTYVVPSVRSITSLLLLLRKVGLLPLFRILSLVLTISTTHPLDWCPCSPTRCDGHWHQFLGWSPSSPQHCVGQCPS